MTPIGNGCSFKNFVIKNYGFRFYYFKILWKAPKNCSEFLALQNTCTAVAYFKRYDFEIFIKT